jgi:hypothetical protein
MFSFYRFVQHVGVPATESHNFADEPVIGVNHQVIFALVPELFAVGNGVETRPLVASSVCSPTASALSGGNSRCQ